MKTSLGIILLSLFGFFVKSGELYPEIKNKTFSKAVYKSFKVEDFKLKEMPILQNNFKGIFHTIYEASDPIGYSYYGRVNTCRIGGCSSDGYAETSINFDSEYFDYLALFDTDGAVVNLKIYNYNATYGYEVCSKFWLKQFKNYDGSKNIEFGKNIDGVSGATVSAEAMTNEIIYKTELLNNWLNEYTAR